MIQADSQAGRSSSVTVAELRYGALVVGWGDQRRQRLEQSITSTTASQSAIPY